MPFAVGAYITAAYWFTSSTSFANPAVTMARAASDTFTGIRPLDVPGFIVAQLFGAGAATAMFRWLVPSLHASAARVVDRSCSIDENVNETPTQDASRPRSDHFRGGETMKTVLFACVHNAGRSQMAAALFNKLADPKRARAISAGTEPGSRVHPEVVEVLGEIGIDVAGVQPRRLTDEVAAGASVVVTMGCGEACPVVPDVERRDWALDDPKGRPLPEVRAIRDEIERRVRHLIDERGWAFR